MADLAVLGIGLDSAPLKEGVKSLEAVVVSAKKAEGAANTLGQTMEDAGRKLGGASKAADRMEKDLQRAEKAMGGVSPAARRVAENMEKVDRASRAANDNTMRFARGLDHLGDEAAATASKLTLLDRVALGVSGAMTKASLALGAIGISAAAGGLALASVVSTANEFQRLGASLKTVTGSAENAQRAMAFIQQFATETPYTLQEVTESFIRLQSLGLDPSRKALESYGNTASAMGKPMMQFIEAVADAMTGEFERLKEFGIRASQNGEKVSLTFQGVTKTIGNNAKEIETYLQGIGRVQFGGAMAEQMSILPGIFGNASDAIDTFKNAIGEGGLTSAVGGVVSRFTEFLNANRDLATSIGAVVGGGIDLYSAALSTLGDAATQAYRWILATGEVLGGMLTGFTAGSDAVSTLGTSLSTVASGFLSSATAIATGWQASGEAIYAVLNAIIGAGVGAYQSIVATWDQLPTAFAALAKSAGNALVSGLEIAVNGAVTGVNRIIAGINSIAPDFAQVPELPAVDLSAFKSSMTEAQGSAAQTITSIMEAAQSTDYLGAGMNAAGGLISAAAARIAEAKKRIDEAAAAGKDLGDAVKLTGEGFQIVVPGAAAAGQAIDGGITKPSKEAAKALRDAEAARKALFSEADAAVGEFFPWKTAEAEQKRLQAIIDDASNGLTDLQRQALGLKINQNFIDAMPDVDRFRERGLRASEDIGESFQENVGDVVQLIFSGGIRSFDDFLSNVVSGLAQIGSRLTSSGLERIMGLFGAGKQGGSGVDVGSVLGMVAANSNIPIPTARPAYQSPSYPYAEKYALPAATMAATKMTNASSSLADVLRDGAAQIGTTARDLAAVISFETGGTFSTSIRGGANNNHIGLIQFGKNEQRMYGAAIGQTLSDQMDAVVSYMKDRGFKAGMDLVDLYSTVNAGRPGRHNASDAANGGTWGTVADKVNSQFGPHLAKADSILGGTTRDLSKGVSVGVRDGLKQASRDPWVTGDGMSLRTGLPEGVTRGGAGLQGALGLFGLAAQGYSSGSPIMGGVSGAMGGLELGSSLGGALGLGAAATPVGMALGAAAGCMGGEIGTKHRRAA